MLETPTLTRYNGQKWKAGVMAMLMDLFSVVYKLIEEVEKQKGNLPNQKFIEEQTEDILEHSVAEYNHTGLFLRNFSFIGVKDSKEIKVQIPKYMIFKVNSDYKRWELKTLRSLGEIEWGIRNLEATDIAVVMFDGIIKDYTLVNEERVVWKHPIHTIEWEEDGEDREQLIYDKVQLEEVIIDLVNQQAHKLRVYNILKQVYEHFQVLGTLYSSQDIKTAPTVLWGYTQEYDEEDFIF